MIVNLWESRRNESPLEMGIGGIEWTKERR